MERIPKQFYTKEFKEEAAKLVAETGLSVAEASRRLSISEQTLRNWIKQLKEGKPLTATRNANALFKIWLLIHMSLTFYVVMSRVR